MEVIDVFMRLGGGTKNSNLNIYAYFCRETQGTEKEEFLRSEYQTDAIGIVVGNEKYDINWNEDGIKFSNFNTKKEYEMLSWTDVKTRITELIKSGQYISKEEIPKAIEHFDTHVAEELVFLYRDDFRNVDCKYRAKDKPTFTEQKDYYIDLLKNHETREFFVAEIESLTHGKPKYSLINTLAKSYLHDITIYPAAEYILPPEHFLSDKQIDNHLTKSGSGFVDGKLRIYSFFRDNKELAERAKFLSKEYGIGGASHTRGGNNHDSRGLNIYGGLDKLDMQKVVLTWSQVVKRIDNLILTDRYLNQEEKAKLSELETIKEEDFDIHKQEYDLHLGLTVHIGTEELELLSITNEKVELFDGTLLPREMPTSVFLRRLSENPLNDYLKKEVSKETSEPIPQIELKEETIEEKEPSPPEKEPEKETEDNKIPEVIPTEITIPKKQSGNLTHHSEVPFEQRINYKITDDLLGVGTAKQKFRQNIEAIKLLKTIEEENRLANANEQEILSKYTGWGGLSDAFDNTKDNWHSEYTELLELLTPEEYSKARESTLSAFYTPPVVIRSIYEALQNMGFSKGNILEPSCGTGNFIGMLPESMKESRFYGVELDDISGRIARKLYQKEYIAISGFEKTNYPDSFFDVAVGNVPFGQFKLADKKYDKQNFLVHDYFFAKTLDKVRPGGVIAFITSKGTMDKENPTVRKYLSQRAELIGAIRLPNSTFKASAGTEVVSDILFLQKREHITEIDESWVHLDTDENGISMNSYFVNNPDMIMGEMQKCSGPFGEDYTCVPYENEDLGQLLKEAISNIHTEINTLEIEETSEENDYIVADPTVKNFSYTNIDGVIYYRKNSMMNKITTTLTGENRIKGLIKIRDVVRDLIDAQLDNSSDQEIRSLQEQLNFEYDSFTKKYGLIRSRANEMCLHSQQKNKIVVYFRVLLAIVMITHIFF